MTIDQYSVLVSLGLFVITGALVAALILYAFMPSVRTFVKRQRYETYIALLALLSLGSIIGAFVYQLMYLTPVCELCWWQRIFLFPISIIGAVAFWYRTREAHVTIAIMALFGLFYSSYHYYYHFQGLVLGNTLALPCSSGGLLPACTESPILTFGFITIPFMGILVFSSMLILVFFAHKKARSEVSQVAI